MGVRYCTRVRVGLYSAKEVARYAGVTTQAVQRARLRGQLQGTKRVAGAYWWHYSAADVATWILARRPRRARLSAKAA